MRTVVAMARASHFAPTVAVSTFATLLALRAGRGGGAVWVGTAVLAGQLSVGWSNDWLDRHRDRQVARGDKPLVRGDVSDRVVLAGAAVAVAVCAALSLYTGVRAGAAHLAAVAAAWGYNLGLKSTPASPLPYAAAFGLLPGFITLGLPGSPWPPWWATVAGALLGAGAHFANALPDLDEDGATGVRGLPHRLGAGWSLAAATVLLGLGTSAVAVGAERLGLAARVSVLATILVVAAVPLTWRAGWNRAAFRLAIGAAGGTVATLLLSGGRLA